MRASPLRPGSLNRHADFTSPLTVPGGEVAGTEIVGELPPELALTVWQVLRSVLMWAAEIPAQRSDLFERRSMEQWERELLEGTFDPDLRFPLAVIVGELADPEAAAPEQLAHACLCVTEWGLAHNATRTALAYTEAAALCRPDYPRYAWMAGRLLRTHGRFREAEQWLQRAVRKASSREDWEAHSRALVALGNLLLEVGNYPAARETQLKALSSARKKDLPELAGMALHDLFAISIHQGRFQEAEQYAREAYDAYGDAHELLSRLAHDVAYFWMETGHFRRALDVFQVLVPHFAEPEQRFRIFANTARAAGAVGEPDLFEALREAAEQEIPRLTSENPLAAGLVELALGALSLDQRDLARRALQRATRLAEQRGEANVVMRAESVRESLEARETIEVHTRLSKEPPTTADKLAKKFVATLSREPGWAVPAHAN
jgi:tetratricopeptide (TPR) repeat protein